MSLEQDTRNFLADPENLSAAQCLVASLCREVNTAHSAALVSMADTSAKTWRGILEAVVAFDEALRPLLIQALQRILREWPVGSRPLPRWPADSPRLNLLNLINTKAIELIDCVYSQALFDIAAVDEIEDFSAFKINLRSTSFGTFYLMGADHERIEFLESRIRQFLNLSQLEHFEFCRAFRIDETLVASVSKSNGVRQNVRKLVVKFLREQLESFLSLSWPSVEELTVVGLEDLVAISSQRMPKLKKVKWSTQRIDQELVDTLLRLSKTREVDLEFVYSHNPRDQDSDLNLLLLLAEFLSEVSFSTEPDIEFPRLNHVRTLELERILDHQASTFVPGGRGLYRFYRSFPNVENLSIEDQEDAFRVVTFESFKNSKIKKLNCSHLMSAQSEDFFRAILQSHVRDLSLNLSFRNIATDWRVLTEFFEALELKKLDLVINDNSESEAFLFFEALGHYRGPVNSLELNRRDDAEYPHEKLIELLASPAMKTLKTLSTFASVDDFVSPANFHSLTLPNLEEISFHSRSPPKELPERLFDRERFPSLLDIRY